PVPGDFPTVPWTERENGFVAIGRMIDLVGRIQARGHDVRMHIVGTSGGDRYGRDVRHRVRTHAAWVTLHEGIDRRGSARGGARGGGERGSRTRRRCVMAEAA
ncbi:MAG: hypothetical protein ACREQL_12660, partial [Candidatus Binatia bacterium]